MSFYWKISMNAVFNWWMNFYFDWMHNFSYYSLQCLRIAWFKVSVRGIVPSDSKLREFAWIWMGLIKDTLVTFWAFLSQISALNKINAFVDSCCFLIYFISMAFFEVGILYHPHSNFLNLMNLFYLSLLFNFNTSFLNMNFNWECY